MAVLRFHGLRVLLLGVGLLLAACASGSGAGNPGPPALRGEGPGLQLDAAAIRRETPPLVGVATEYTAPPHRFVADDGTVLPVRRWGPAPERGEAPGAVVLGIHGFNDHGGGLVATAAALVPDGIAVYAWDQRGFGATAQRGRWAGTELLADDIVALSSALRQRYPDIPLLLLGQSMGGALTALALERPEPPAIDGVILVAPAFWGRDAMPWYQRSALWLGRHLFPWATFTGEGLGIRPTDDPAVGRQLAGDPLWIRETRVDAMHGIADAMDAALARAPDLDGAPPLLIQVAGRDEVIPPAAACALFESLTDSAGWRALFYPEGYHMLTRYSGAGTVMADIRGFIADPRAPLPSGREVSRAEGIALTCD